MINFIFSIHFNPTLTSFVFVRIRGLLYTHISNLANVIYKQMLILQIEIEIVYILLLNYHRRYQILFSPLTKQCGSQAKPSQAKPNQKIFNETENKK